MDFSLVEASGGHSLVAAWGFLRSQVLTEGQRGTRSMAKGISDEATLVNGATYDS